MSVPVFAVVGHPNKGKSSLVATLARDQTVAIGVEPGTTIQTRRFPMRVSGETLYVLVDTPGFQRARSALEWMQHDETDTASRPSAVERFVRVHTGEERFKHECELLEPIVAGAGIIYVVDGAAPYGPEYDAEMEILRWTGQPSMAVINPIGNARFIDSWENALGQFFKVVRVLDVMQAPFTQQLEVLKAFGQLRNDWRRPLNQAVEALIEDRDRQAGDSATIIAEMIAAALACQETKDLPKEAAAPKYTAALEEKYRGRLRQMEHRARREVESIYGHADVERHEAEMELLETDLLSKESWLAFGLKRRDLVTVGALGGALVGAMADAALLGASFLTGSILGGVVGGTLGYFSSDKLAEIRILKQPLGGQRLRCGPTRNLQFPFVLLNRARLHQALVAGRTHAQRDALEVDANDRSAGELLEPLGEEAKRGLARQFDRIRRTEPGSESHLHVLDQLTDTVSTLIAEAETARD
jgi:GTPase Era involved in 16S rRNA processing